MSVPRRPFTYIPDEYFDFGFAGEHPVTFLAWVDDREPGIASVSIIKVWITPTFRCEGSNEWDITAKIKQYPERERRYEDEIRADFEKAKDKDYAQEEGA